MVSEESSSVAELATLISQKIIEQLKAFPPVRSPWLTVEDAAAYVHMTKRGLEDMRARGVGPKYAKVGERLIRYRIDHLDEWLMKGGSHE